MDALTLFGVVAVTSMMVFYALEDRDRRFILAFAAACLLASAYGFLQGAWPFGVVEAVWAAVAVRRWRRRFFWLTVFWFDGGQKGPRGAGSIGSGKSLRCLYARGRKFAAPQWPRALNPYPHGLFPVAASDLADRRCRLRLWFSGWTAAQETRSQSWLTSCFSR
jgi:hypothetical protein